MSIKVLVFLGGGGGNLVLGGGKCRFYFYGREDFSDFWSKTKTVCCPDGLLGSRSPSEVQPLGEGRTLQR